MPLKSTKKTVTLADKAERATSIEHPAPIEDADLSKTTLGALAENAKRLKTVPARAFSKDEIKRFLKKS